MLYNKECLIDSLSLVVIAWFVNIRKQIKVLGNFVNRFKDGAEYVTQVICNTSNRTRRLFCNVVSQCHHSLLSVRHYEI